MESSLVKDSPLLLPLNKEKTVYDGFITVQERDFRMRILLPPDRQVKRARLHCCWQLKHLLRGYEHIVKQRLQQSTDLVSFILELKTVLEVGLKSHPECRSIPPPQYYSQLISEMETLGWVKLLFIDTEFRTLRLNAEDSSGRQHVLTVKLKPKLLPPDPAPGHPSPGTVREEAALAWTRGGLDGREVREEEHRERTESNLMNKHPAEAPECSADLPVPLALTWTPQSTLDNLHKQFLLVLESLTEFWDVLDEIDSKTWILEPEKPNRSHTMRRIAIGNNVSMKVEVDPRHPKMLPECCLLGPEHVVTPLRNKLNANMHLWNPDSSVLHNLRDVLEIEFPSPATHEKSSFSVECGICYSYRLEAAIPDQVCNDPRCGQPFHQACLYEWLRALPSSRQSFNIVFGECPYCSKPITVKMAGQKS
ncbi:E3 ubiquitin-protein ligase FANCL isoform X1 [Micropterus dolomieu]|uniref:E3 ubiquitin-protein ligase FANCL isoform X1 n=1 Tax=Micropterus dolomieu TaxID=147949 RepID=UPI001E8DCB1F|nr:E3 ubiquitin-protein ligase FANCL isoform X1 [Micropterus dolomieu]